MLTVGLKRTSNQKLVLRALIKTIKCRVYVFFGRTDFPVTFSILFGKPWTPSCLETLGGSRKSVHERDCHYRYIVEEVLLNHVSEREKTKDVATDTSKMSQKLIILKEVSHMKTYWDILGPWV